MRAIVLRSWVSASSMPLAGKCAASQALPRVLTVGGKGKMGDALHEHLFERVHYGIDDAVRRLPVLAIKHDLDERETGIFIARATGFSWTPPRGALPEIGLCLYDDGSVRPVKGGKGVYDPGEGALIPMSLDVFWAEPKPLFKAADGRVRCPPDSVLWAVDFKSGGDVWTDPVEKNLQTLAAVVAAAKWTGAREAVPGILYLRKGAGDWDVPEVTLGRDELVKAEDLLRKVVHRVRDARAAYAAGEPLTYATGAHCTYCPCEAYCPAKLAQIKGILDGEHALGPGALTQAQAVRLAEMATSISRLNDATKAALEAHTKAFGPIALPDGRMWGPYAHVKEELDVDLALKALAEEGVEGEDAHVAMKRTISKTGIDAAIAAVHKREGISRQKKSAMGRILGRLRSWGGIRPVVETWHGLYQPTAQTTSTPASRLPEGVPIDGDE